MKLKSVQIKNFRCFDSLSIDLDEQLTVLVAKNGQGKSAVLDAIRVGLWTFVGGFDLARNPASYTENNISIDDVRMPPHYGMQRQLPCEITLQGSFDINLKDNGKNIKEHSWTRILDKEAPGSKTKSKKTALLVKNLAEAAQAQVRDPEGLDINLPVIGYYGTGRLWRKKRSSENKKTKKRDNDFFMRLFGYRNCLDPSSSYEDFADWFTWIFKCYMEEKFKLYEITRLTGGILPNTQGSVWSNIVQVVQQVTNIVLEETGWHTLEYSFIYEESLVLEHKEYGALKVEQLSDGIRNVLGMVADIAYRCIKLNPHLGLNAANETCGVVMIDEIDMHLHPAWQQTILGNLIKAFPKIQFIVTTHSPQVISTVPSHQVRILDVNNVYSAEAGTQGAESSRILKRIFGVDPRPQNDPNTKLLNEYLDLVYADKWEKAKTKREQLDVIYQRNEPALTEADLYIENRQWELKIEDHQ